MSRPHYRSTAILTLLVLLSAADEEAGCQQECTTVCKDGSSVGLPGKVLDFIPAVPGFGVGALTCGLLEFALSISFSGISKSDCLALQSIGAICGCPSEANSCSLCDDGEHPLAPSRDLDFVKNVINIEGSGVDIIPTCEITDAYLRTNEEEGSINCRSAQTFLTSYCHCPRTSDHLGKNTDPEENPCKLCTDGSGATLLEQEIGIHGFAFTTCKQIEDGAALLLNADAKECGDLQKISTLCGCPRRADSCSICPRGGTIAYPDKKLHFLKKRFQGFVPTCKTYEAYTHSLETGSAECAVVQLASSICGCHAIPDHCEIDGTEPLDAEDFRDIPVDPRLTALMGVQEDVFFEITCEVAMPMKYQLQKDDRRCFLLQSRSDDCGYNDGQNFYGGGKNDDEKAVLAWLPRISGILSFIGAVAILIDVGRSEKKRDRIYSKLMACMAIFSALSSIGWIVSTVASPTDDVWPIFGELGSEETCKAQAFFIQLALATVMYNVSLMAYYYLVIDLRWRTDKLKSAVAYLHILPVVGVTMALVGIPFYGSVLVSCHIVAPPLLKSWAPVAVLHFLPVIFALFASTLLLFLVWLKVKERKAVKTACAVTSTIEKFEQEALKQAIVYLLWLYVSGLSSLVFFWRLEATSYRGTCAALFLMPLQGALNSVNYFRPALQHSFHRTAQRLRGDARTKQLPSQQNPERRSVSQRSDEDDDASLSNDILEPSAFLERASPATRQQPSMMNILS